MLDDAGLASTTIAHAGSRGLTQAHAGASPPRRQVLPPLVGTVPEARLNLVIFHMHNNEVQEAYELMKEIEPTSPQEYILKGVTNLALGQQMDSREHLKVAQQCLQLPGRSVSSCPVAVSPAAR